MRITLTREKPGPAVDHGTFGRLKSDGFACVTAELPWRDNAPDISCIPTGVYQCTFRWSNAHARHIYHVEGVPFRDAIEIHSGNFAGNTAHGLRSDSKGCILLGRAFAVFPSAALPSGQVFQAQRGVTSSRDVLAEFEKYLSGQSFELEISETA